MGVDAISQTDLVVELLAKVYELILSWPDPGIEKATNDEPLAGDMLAAEDEPRGGER